MSRIRTAALASGVLAASLLFVGVGASAAHAEMDGSEAPTQADVDWTPGAGGTYSTGGSSMNDWVADQYQSNGTSIFGWDYYTRWDGQNPLPGDAEKFAHNYNYKSCIEQWWHPGQLACTD